MATYLAQRSDVKPGTMRVMQQAERHLNRCLGRDTLLGNIGPREADRFKAFLQDRGIAKATITKWCRYGRQFFATAVRWKLVEENPFAHIKGVVKGDPKRRVFVLAEHIEQVIDAAPDPQWKLLIALARYGGLRIPNEALALKWRHVNWEQSRFAVHASKTEHHRDGGVRVCPIFPELRPSRGPSTLSLDTAIPPRTSARN